MSDSTRIDLAHLEPWQGLRPGMTRPEVLAALQQRGLEASPYGECTLIVTEDEWEMELYFAGDGSERLRQLSFEDGEFLWAGRRIFGEPLGKALQVMALPEPPLWTPWDTIRLPFPTPEETPVEPPTDEKLLEDATAWLPQRGLGLVVFEGMVRGVVWRGNSDLPARYYGPVTSAQCEMSVRPDLESYLREKHLERVREPERKDPLRFLRGLVTIATVLALAWIAKEGFEVGSRWKQAPQLTAKFVAVEQHPFREFRDFLPPELRWVIPKKRTLNVDHYRVAYLTPAGEQREAVLERGEFYVPPQQPGDEMPIVYLEGNPAQVKGLSRARDFAFIEYVPRAIVVGILWLAAQFLLAVLPAIWRLLAPLLRRLLSSRGVKDPDRPELS